MENCAFCKLNVNTYNNKCSGCRSRLIHSTRPSQLQAQNMLGYLHRACRLDRKYMVAEYKSWLQTQGDRNEQNDNK
jgi:hypothetical protein